MIPSARSRLAVHLWAVLAYGVTSVAFHWPLPIRLGSALTGPVSGDTGVYVWNLWVFRHEVVAHQRFPLFTGEILSLTPPVDLSLHNYTLFSNLLAFPLIPLFGVTATFNLIYLGLGVLTAWAAFLLAREITGRPIESWLAGLLFAFSPILIARGSGHFSLAAAAPLPIFAWILVRAERELTMRRALAGGATMAWATASDAYFGIYCVLFAACYWAARRTTLSVGEWTIFRHTRLERALDALGVVLAAVVLGIAITGGGDVVFLGARIAMRSLHTPVLLLTLLVSARLWLVFRPVLTMPALRPKVSTVKYLAASAVALVLPLTPVFYALAFRLRDDGVLQQTVHWRSSPRGVDLLAFFGPNPENGWFGEGLRRWLAQSPNGYMENVAALTLVGLLTVGLAVWKYRFRPPAAWLAVFIFFVGLALGPFVNVAGVNTYVPGPWALLRYVPFISAARMPTRFAIAAMMAFAVLFALALAHLADRWPHRRRALLACVGLALAFEVAPVPRRLIDTPRPSIYEAVAADARDVRVFEIPFGIRDGERSAGNFTAASLFYQTVHEKPLVGGYLSRITDNEFRRHRTRPLLDALMRMSEGLPPGIDADRARRLGRRFARQSRVGYVVVDVAAASPELQAFVIDAMDLDKIGESEGRALYVPRQRRPRGPPDAARHRGRHRSRRQGRADQGIRNRRRSPGVGAREAGRSRNEGVAGRPGRERGGRPPPGRLTAAAEPVPPGTGSAGGPAARGRHAAPRAHGHVASAAIQRIAVRICPAIRRCRVDCSTMMFRRCTVIPRARLADRSASAMAINAARSAAVVPRPESIRSRSLSSNSGADIASSREMSARPSGSGTSVTPAIRFSAGSGLTRMTALSPYLASSAAGSSIASATSGWAKRTTARPRSSAIRVRAAMTSSGRVSVTAREGRPNFGGRPRLGGRSFIAITLFW
jgi:hypothetical protein